MLSIAAAFSVRNLPSMAVQGWPLIFCYLLGTLLFLVPLALTSAELASTWPRDGGVYNWVAEAFGERSGFMAVWAIVVQNLPWYPTVLAFVAVALAYGFDPALENNRIFVAVVMIAVFWMLTLLSLRGQVAAARSAAFGPLFGSIVPAVALVVAGVGWLAAAKPIALPPFTFAHLIPTWDVGK